MKRGTATGMALAGLLLLGGCGEPPEQEVAEDCPSAEPMGLLGARAPATLFNAYYLQEEATRSLRQGASSSAQVREVFDKARRLGIRWIRTNGFNDDPSKAGDSAIQLAPGVEDELGLRGLDLVLHEAAEAGIPLLLPLGNYWSSYGGTEQYVAWAGLAHPVEGDPRFFTHPAVRALYRDQLRRILTRVNSLDGIPYAVHPGVLGWELLNEARGAGLDASGAEMRAWVDEMGGVVKALSPDKALGTGEEGFEADLSPGTSFRLNTASSTVDFATLHFYPEVWGVAPERTAAAGAQWIASHASTARDLGKPLVLEEFGLMNEGGRSLDSRRALYRGWLRCARKVGLAGAGPWMFAVDARPDGWDDYSFRVQDGTALDDPRNRYADILHEAAAVP